MSLSLTKHRSICPDEPRQPPHSRVTTQLRLGQPAGARITGPLLVSRPLGVPGGTGSKDSLAALPGTVCIKTEGQEEHSREVTEALRLQREPAEKHLRAGESLDTGSAAPGQDLPRNDAGLTVPCWLRGMRRAFQQKMRV